jgi:parallel beta-helix repeat protein
VLLRTRLALAFGLTSLAVGATADTLRVPSDFLTIQAAVDFAASGDVIDVAKGTYDETVVISGKTQLTLRGKAKPTIDGGDAGVPLRIEGSQGIVVDGFALADGFEDDLQIVGSSDVTVRRCELDGGALDGISVDDSTDVLIEKNRFADQGDDGIDFDQGEGPVTNSVISKNRFDKVADDAIDLDGSGHLVEKNRASRCDQGIHVNEGSTGNSIEKNTISNTGNDGIELDGSDNDVLKNKIDRAGDEGIAVHGDGNRVEKNKIDRADDEAIDVEGSNNEIISNLGKNSRGNGVEVGEEAAPGEATGNLFEHNKIFGSAEHGFLVRDTGNTFRANKAAKSGGFDLLDETVPGGNVYLDNKFGTQQVP